MTRRRDLNFLSLAVVISIIAVLCHRLVSDTVSTTPDMSTTVRPAAGAPPQQVIVVGAGLAGLCASYAALRAGAPAVRLLERAARPGGNSVKASSGINGAPTRWQPTSARDVYGHPATGKEEPEKSEEKLEDTFFYADTVRSAGVRLSSAPPPARAERERLISRLTHSSAAAVSFLADDIGVDLSVVARLGGHSFPRTHRGAGKTPPGAAIVFALLDRLQADPRFALLTGHEVTRLLPREASAADGSTGNLAMAGVEFATPPLPEASPSSAGETDGHDATSTRDARYDTLLGPVVFATGGFAGDARGLLAAYRPDLTALPSTNDARPGAHGVLEAAGARLVDMEAVQVHPTGFVDPAAPGAPVKFLAAEMLRGEGGILLRRGRRFVDELQTRDVVSAAIMEGDEPAMVVAGDNAGGSGGVRQWDVRLLLDPGACEAAAAHVGFYLFKGLLEKKRIRDLDETTRETLADYVAIVKGCKADPLGRASFGHWTWGIGDDAADEDAEVCVGRVTPITHFTMGGAVINEKSQVLASDLGQESGQLPIRGLWAAGEITGGIHGDNRLGGSSLLECVVYGLTAGEEAARSLSGA